MSMSGDFERMLREPKSELTITPETLFILNKANELLSEHGTQDATDGDLYTLAWSHRDGGLKVALESSVAIQLETQQVREYTVVTLIAIDRRGGETGTATSLSYSYPASEQAGAVTVSYRQYAAVRRYNGFFERDEWVALHTKSAAHTPNEGVFAWFEVGLSLMETELRPAAVQLHA